MAGIRLYGCGVRLLNMFTERREEFWVLAAFAGTLAVALTLLFAVGHAKGYRWKRADTKALPPAKQGNEDVTPASTGRPASPSAR